MNTILQLEQISKRFPGVNALTKIDLSVAEGKFTPCSVKTARENRR